MPNNGKKVHKKRPSMIEQIIEQEVTQGVFDEIAFLKKRIHLVEGERKANYESNEEILKNNEARIQELKTENTRLRRQQADMVRTCDNYFLIVSRSLGSEREAYAFRGKSFHETIDILECRIGDLKNKLNLQKFTRGQLKLKIQQLQKDEDMLEKFIKNSEDIKQNPRMAELRELENSIALMHMKITEAENIRARYKIMLTVIKDDNFKREIKITGMGRVIEQQKKEIERMQSILQDAQKARKKARAKLEEVEAETIQEYTQREDDLLQARVKLEAIHTQMEAIGAKLTFPKFHMIHRDSSVSEGMYSGIQATPQGEERPKTITEIVYIRLSEMTGESDPELILARFTAQREHAKALELEEAEAKAEVRRCKIRKKFLQHKLNELKFSGGLRRETLDERSHLIFKEKDVTSQQRLEADQSVSNYTNIMHEMLVKLHEICTNNKIKVPTTGLARKGSISPSEKFVGDQILAILKHILKKLEKVFEVEECRASPTSDGEKGSGGSGNSQAGGGGIKRSSLTRSSYDDQNILRRLSTNEEGSLGNRRLSIIDLISNEGDIVGRNIIAETQSLTDIEEAPSTVPGEKRDEDSQIQSALKRSDSSDEEEAVSRLAIKRQSHMLVEAKTRKGRFNTGMSLPVRRRN